MNIYVCFYHFIYFPSIIYKKYSFRISPSMPLTCS